MDLKQLAQFVAVCEEGSFSQAAQRRRAVFALLIGLCAALPALAANLDGSWQAQCASGETPGQRACAVLAAAPIGDGPADFVQLLVSPTGGAAFMFMVRPSDGQATACTVRVDAAEPVRSESVLAGACLFTDADGALVERLRRGTTLRLTIRAADDREIAVTFLLAGFARAVDAARR
jgi:invasion protein IalB